MEVQLQIIMMVGLVNYRMICMTWIKKLFDSIMDTYDKDLVSRINEITANNIRKLLKEPFIYIPTEYFEENKCVVPALWLLVPDSLDE